MTDIGRGVSVIPDGYLLGEGDLGLAWLKLLFVFIVLLAIPAPVIASIGKVLSVKPGAEITRSGKKIRLREGMDLVSGDTISTNRTGVVQLLFVDETKIAVGPNAQMILDVSMLRGNRKAKNFTVQALGGSFRFISGKSRKRAYSIKTPSATMAVRGTTFDMWITSQQQSAMLVLEGTVQMCGRRGSCRSASRQCSMFATNSGGQVGRPADQAQYDKALKGGFPFVRSQQNLLPSFQFRAEGCSDRTASVPQVDPLRPDRNPAAPREEATRREVQSRTEAPARQSGDNPGARSSVGSGTSSGAGVSSGGGLNVSADPSGGSAAGSGAQATATAGDVTATAGW